MQQDLLLTHNQPEFTVSALSQAIKGIVEESFSLVRVRGEVSGFKRHTSGHLYFSVKDEEAVLNAVCWRGQASKIKFALQEGLEVVITGRITTYPGRSNYQILVESIEPAGEGALMAMLEKLRVKLAAEGLFDLSRKLPIPKFPSKIGVITSPTGAVIRDILHRINERWPCNVQVWPVAVQGEGAVLQVSEAIQGFNKLSEKPDVIIIARGGGSLEDLWCFNEEIVVRAAASSKIPIISAIGHETDTTLIDFAASLRAPTPTGAAELAVPVRADLLSYIMESKERMYRAISKQIQQIDTNIRNIYRVLSRPDRLLEIVNQKLDDKSERLQISLPNIINRMNDRVLAAKSRLSPILLDNLLQRYSDRLKIRGNVKPNTILSGIINSTDKLNTLQMLLNSFHYKKILARGFALVRDNEGKIVNSVSKTNSNQPIEIELSDGSIKALVK